MNVYSFDRTRASPAKAAAKIPDGTAVRPVKSSSHTPRVHGGGGNVARFRFRLLCHTLSAPAKTRRQNSGERSRKAVKVSFHAPRVLPATRLKPQISRRSSSGHVFYYKAHRKTARKRTPRRVLEVLLAVRVQLRPSFSCAACGKAARASACRAAERPEFRAARPQAALPIIERIEKRRGNESRAALCECYSPSASGAPSSPASCRNLTGVSPTLALNRREK